jgi:hypothetical protein
MIIAYAMNACAQAMERFKADVTAHVGQIEAGLALGAEPATEPFGDSGFYELDDPRHGSFGLIRLHEVEVALGSRRAEIGIEP